MKNRAVTILILAALTLACSKSGDRISAGENRAPVSPGTNSISTSLSGSGATVTSSAIDNTAQKQVKSPLPQPAGFVNDYAKVIDGQTKDKLEATLKKLKQRAGIEFAVVTVDTTNEQSSFDYAMAVARGWGIGANNPDGGGIILLIAVKDHKWELRWTHSLESDLQDNIKDELERQMVSQFPQQKYSEGIASGVELVISKLAERRKFSMQ